MQTIFASLLRALNTSHSPWRPELPYGCAHDSLSEIMMIKSPLAFSRFNSATGAAQLVDPPGVEIFCAFVMIESNPLRCNLRAEPSKTMISASGFLRSTQEA